MQKINTIKDAYLILRGKRSGDVKAATAFLSSMDPSEYKDRYREESRTEDRLERPARKPGRLSRRRASLGFNHF